MTLFKDSYPDYSKIHICAFCEKEINRDIGMYVILYPKETVFCSKECRDKLVKEEKENKSA